MRKSLVLAVLALVCLVARAVPADPTPVKVTQPDGTTLTISLHGDEFFHFTTTADGYTVLKNAAAITPMLAWTVTAWCLATVSPVMPPSAVPPTGRLLLAFPRG